MDSPVVASPVSAGAHGTLLERDRELALVDDLIADALDGRSVLGLFEGAAGIGKSSLLSEARARAERAGFRVLSARASDLERELPFGIVRQLFEPMLLDPAARERWLTASAESAARVFEPPEDADATGEVSFGILYGLFWLTANVAAEGPLCLSIDDLHWSDPASLRFIAYLERRLEGLRVLLLTAVRPGEPNAPAKLLGEIGHDPAVVAVRPPTLSEVAVAELVRARLGEEPAKQFTDACHAATGGNPLLIGELLKTLQAERVSPDAAHASLIADVGPRAVSRTVLLRLSRLSADAIAVARAVSVLGDGAAMPTIAAVAQLDEQRVAEATRALMVAEILRREAPLGFVHPLVRDAVYHELSPAERELEHERAAKALIDLGSGPEPVATHLLAIPRRADPQVTASLQVAGLTAARRGDADSAAAYLRRALDEPAPASERPQLLLELGMVEANLNAPAAVEHLREAHELLTDPLARTLAAEQLARMLLFTSPAAEAIEAARMAAAHLSDEQADRRRSIEAFELYSVAFGAEVPDASARLASVRADGVRSGLGAKMLSAVAAWDWALSGGTAAECGEYALASLADGELIAEDPGFMTIVANSVLVLADRDEALWVWDSAMAAARRFGSVFAVCGVHLWRGWTWLQRGELAEAEASLWEAHEETVLVEDQDGAGMAYVVGFLTRVLLERGDLAGARELLATGPDPGSGSDGEALLRRAAVELLLSEGEWARALEEAEEYGALVREVRNPAWAPWMSLQALALDGLGKREQAIGLLEGELELARQWGAPGALGRCLRLLGTMHGQTGLEMLREAVDVTDAPAARLEHAKALVALGSALRRTRQPSRSRDPLRVGFEIATRASASRLADHARTELYAAGGRPRRSALAGRESLTPSELRIAELAAEGQSNREIAQSLFVTPKTVEVHLTSVYRKLGIGARGGLGDALSQADTASVATLDESQ